MKNASAPLQVGVIGAGYWATYAHIPAILEHPRAALLAVQSRSQDKADKVAKDFGAKYAVTDPIALLDLPELDAVVIATTPNMHHAQAKAALERGKHVLIEKPMTFTAGEARELCDLADAKGVQLLISCPWHFTPHGMAVREMIRSGELGDIRMISVLMTNPIDKLLKGINTTPTHDQSDVYLEPCKGSYNDPTIAGGGQIYCQISHAAAYLSFLTGLRPREVFARFEYEGSINDIYDVLTVTMDNGALVSMASTGATPLVERNYEVRVYGTKGIALLELWKGEATVVPFEGEGTILPTLAPGELYPEREPLNNLVDAALGLAPNGSDGRLGLAAMEIIQAACESSKTNVPVRVQA